MKIEESCYSQVQFVNSTCSGQINGMFTQVIPTEDRLEALKAFKEKRKPLYTGK